MKKVSFYLSALALVAFAACNNAAEEAVVEETVDTTVVEEIEPAMDEPSNQEEITQTSGSSTSKFTCKDGSPIKPAWIGDGECDCPECEDEN